MAMALHSAQMAASTFDPKKKVWCCSYQRAWKKEFSARMRRGRILQRFFGSPALSAMMLFVLKRLPRLRRAVIAGTHGQGF
jgi:flavin-dependent dehydrogenase